MISRNIIRNITYALLAYFVFYAILYGAAVFVINYDAYRMRILFNYLNLNGNKSGILIHIITLLAISFIILYMNTKLNPDVLKQPPGDLSDQAKVSLMYKFEIVTMITWIFLILIVAIM
jgi:hypothetical protein